MIIKYRCFGPSAETANGFSTSLMVLGKEAGLELVNKYPEFRCIMITDEGKILSSKNLDVAKYRHL